MTRIAFICTENANRSQIAEAFARRHGGDRIEAHSAGSAPAARVNPRAHRSMASIGLDLSDRNPKSIDELPSGEWDYVVTMGCGDSCPALPARQRLDWELEDPRDLEGPAYDAVRDEIERRVLKLLASIG